MLLGLIIIDQHLSILPEPPRLLLRRLHHREHIARLRKDAIHLLQGPVGGFGVEEIHDGDDEGVSVEKRSLVEEVGQEGSDSHNSKDDVCLVFDTLKRNRRDHHHHEIERPIRARGKRIRWRTNLQRHNLCWI